jgi:C1A family cysteine protease
MKKQVLNLKPSIKDKRNYKHKNVSLMALTLPPRVSWRSEFPIVYNQGSLGTCYAHLGVEMLEHRRVRLGLPRFRLSRMFLSYVIRMIEANGKPNHPEMYTDNGASILDTAKGMQKYGTVLEEIYPYQDSTSYFKQIPRRQNSNLTPEQDFNLMLDFAKFNSAYEYLFVNTVQEAKDALNKGYVVGIGTDVYNNFYNLKNGIYNGQVNNDNYVGGHAIVLVGYDDEKQAFEFLNSWNIDYGEQGFGWISYNYTQTSIDKFDAFRISHYSEYSHKVTGLIRIANFLTSPFRKK